MASWTRRKLIEGSGALLATGCSSGASPRDVVRPGPMDTGGDTGETGDSGGNPYLSDPGVFTPEMFGAVGDGITNDYEALRQMAMAVTDYAVVRFRQGATYRIDEIKEASPHHVRPVPRGLNGIDDIIIRADDLLIELNGARIEHGPMHRSIRPGDRFSRDATVVPLFLDRCHRVRVQGPGGFYGPAETSSKDAGVGEGACHGVCVYGGDDIVFDNVTFSQWLADGLWVGAYGEDPTHRITAGRVMTRGCLFSHNARQGVSVVGCQEYRDLGSTMRDTGNTVYGFHSPASGCDIEPQPNQTAPTNARFIGTRFINNTGAVFAASDVHGGLVGIVDLDGVEASLDAATPRNRAVAPAFTVSADRVSMRNCTLDNVYIRLAGACHLHAEQISITVSDPEIPCITVVANTTPTVEVEGCTIRFTPPETSYTIAIKTLGGQFRNNEVFVNAAAHDAADTDIVGEFTGAVLEGNHWATDTTAALPWVVVADASPDTDTYSGFISR